MNNWTPACVGLQERTLRQKASSESEQRRLLPLRILGETAESRRPMFFEILERVFRHLSSVASSMRITHSAIEIHFWCTHLEYHCHTSPQSSKKELLRLGS